MGRVPTPPSHGDDLLVASVYACIRVCIMYVTWMALLYLVVVVVVVVVEKQPCCNLFVVVVVEKQPCCIFLLLLRNSLVVSWCVNAV